jgi:uncharacterized lipoprotein YajG
MKSKTLMFLVVLITSTGLTSCSISQQARVTACPKWTSNTQKPDNQDNVKYVAFK